MDAETESMKLTIVAGLATLTRENGDTVSLQYDPRLPPGIIAGDIAKRLSRIRDTIEVEIGPFKRMDN